MGNHAASCPGLVQSQAMPPAVAYANKEDSNLLDSGCPTNVTVRRGALSMYLASFLEVCCPELYAVTRPQANPGFRHATAPTSPPYRPPKGLYRQQT